MNQAQVNQEWWRSAQTERANREQAGTALLQAAGEWVQRCFPDLCDDGHPDPFLLLAALRLKGRDPSLPVTKAQVVEYATAYHRSRHERGWLNDDDLAEELGRLGVAA